jgi:hypothetical protein
MIHNNVKQAVESSKERRNRRVDELLRDPEIKAAVHRDQRRRSEDTAQRHPEPRSTRTAFAR